MAVITNLNDSNLGSTVQAYDAGLASIAGLTTAADKMIYTTASDAYAVSDLKSTGRSFLGSSDISSALATLDLVKVTITGMDGLSTIPTPTIYTVPGGKSFIPVQAYVRLTALTGLATTGVIKIYNDTQSIDLFPNTTLTGLTATGKVFPLILSSSVLPVSVAGDVLKVTMTTAYTVATVVTLSVDLVGYLV